MTIISDFDYTLFDSALLQQKQAARMKALGVGDEQWTRVKQEFISGDDTKGLLVSNEEYARLISEDMSIDEDAVLGELNKIFTGPCTELFSDAITFLEWCQSFQNVLVTFGSEQYQKQKIAYAGIENLFDEVCIVQDDKSPVLEAVIRGGHYAGPYFFLDDKPASFRGIKRRGLPLTTILVQHKESQRTMEADENCDMVVKSLAEAQRVIEKENL